MASMALEVLRALIAARAQLDSLRKSDSRFDGMTALQQACIHGSTEAMGSSKVLDPKGFLLVSGTLFLFDENRLVFNKLLKLVCLGKNRISGCPLPPLQRLPDCQSTPQRGGATLAVSQSECRCTEQLGPRMAWSAGCSLTF